jgi:hypothetical protein
MYVDLGVEKSRVGVATPKRNYGNRVPPQSSRGGIPSVNFGGVAVLWRRQPMEKTISALPANGIVASTRSLSLRRNANMKAQIMSQRAKQLLFGADQRQPASLAFSMAK